MTANRSLDEFADAGSGDAIDDSGPSETSADDGSSPVSGNDGAAIATTEAAEPATDSSEDTDGAATTDDEPPAPPSSTYVWSSDGGPCGACGETVEERWRDGDDLVCVGCKEW